MVQGRGPPVFCQRALILLALLKVLEKEKPKASGKTENEMKRLLEPERREESEHLLRAYLPCARHFTFLVSFGSPRSSVSLELLSFFN